MAKKKNSTASVRLKYIGNTRYIVPGKRLPSGKTINVFPGDVVNVSSADAAVLESIGRLAGCCGAPPMLSNYFVKES